MDGRAPRALCLAGAGLKSEDGLERAELGAWGLGRSFHVPLFITNDSILTYSPLPEPPPTPALGGHWGPPTGAYPGFPILVTAPEGFPTSGRRVVIVCALGWGKVGGRWSGGARRGGPGWRLARGQPTSFC